MTYTWESILKSFYDTGPVWLGVTLTLAASSLAHVQFSRDIVI